MSLVIPANKWVDNFATACKTKPFSLPWRLISIAVLSLIFATIMSICMVAYFVAPHVGFGMILLFTWLHAYPYVLIAVYIGVLIFAPIGVAIAKKCCGVPAQAPPAA